MFDLGFCETSRNLRSFRQLLDSLIQSGDPIEKAKTMHSFGRFGVFFKGPHFEKMEIKVF